MLEFKPMRLSDGDTYRRYAKDMRSGESSFAAIFGWMHKNRMHICEHDGLFFRFMNNEDRHYLFPLSLEPMSAELAGRAVALMEADAKARGIPLKMIAVNPEQKALIDGKGFVFTESRNYADYLYNAQDLLELPGKKYHSKRNFIARFMRENDWQYEEITNANLNDVWAFQDRWCRKNGCDTNISLQEEATCIAIMLYNLDNLNAKGGLLRANGKVVAFTVASRVGCDTIEIHIEKADYDVTGSYPMINREFLRHNLTPDIKYINREEDLGLENLRKAKLSYHPCALLEKYKAVYVGHDAPGAPS
ncbi:MAG: phosphatidylglycerol lysyltransferase domain-containing protein [Oscillospiraceae bacterium]|nr:phosphatidylglycerol lysyltransferase domain-containing protein [Oscillospiraceae bacterium]